MRPATPGVYSQFFAPAPAPGGTRMDVCAFVGVAPRGPARVPLVDGEWPGDRPCLEPERPRLHSVAVAVESFGEYRALFGGFEGPGLLPYAVASFFEQGGKRAYVVRVVHAYGDERDRQGVARGALRAAGQGSRLSLGLQARSEGSWGNRLTASLRFVTRPLRLRVWPASHDGEAGLVLGEEGLPAGSLLRLFQPDGKGGGRWRLAFVRGVGREFDLQARRYVLVARLDGVADLGGLSREGGVRAEVVTATLRVRDEGGPVPGEAGVVRLRPRQPGAPAMAPEEVHEDLGLSPAHPRWIGQVLCYESALLYPEAEWALGSAPLDLPDADLPPLLAPAFAGGADRYEDLVPDDFLDPLWTPGDDLPGRGVHALVHVPDVASVVVPDLYCAAPLPPQAPAPARPRREPRFVDVATPELPPPPRIDPELPGLRLDPDLPADLEQITRLQERLIELAESLGRFVVLLDVPPRVPPQGVLRWRARLQSSYAAAYHPWLLSGRDDDGRQDLVSLPPSAVAAGIIAAVEGRSGLAFGPANRLAQAVVGVERVVSPDWQEALHRAQINLFLREPAGVRLTLARTLSGDPRWRQLSVRRMMLMLRRLVERRTRWAVFEPNTAALRLRLRVSLEMELRRLYRQRWFQGNTEAQAFFVRCDEGLNPRESQDQGRLLAEIGVAPAEPMEFLLLRLSRDADGGLLFEERT